MIDACLRIHARSKAAGALGRLMTTADWRRWITRLRVMSGYIALVNEHAVLCFGQQSYETPRRHGSRKQPASCERMALPEYGLFAVLLSVCLIA